MLVTDLFVVSALVVAFLGCVALFAFKVYRRYRYRKIVICPDTHDFAEVALDARKAALNAVLGELKVCVKSCSYWPRKKGCGEDCVKENWPLS